MLRPIFKILNFCFERCNLAVQEMQISVFQILTPLFYYNLFNGYFFENVDEFISKFRQAVALK